MSNQESTTIFGWMISDLGLKNEKLLIYSIIYNRSQDGISAYRSGKEHIAEFLGIDVKSVSEALKKLEEKQLISYEKIDFNNTIIEEYKANLKIFSKENVDPQVHTRKVYKPTIAEIEKEIEINRYRVNALKFWNYYEDKHWKADGKRIGVSKWKEVLKAWHANGEKFRKERNAREMDLIFVKGMEERWDNDPEAVAQYREIKQQEAERAKRIKKYKESQNEQDHN